MKSKLQITNIACIGGGVIGAGWLARLVENGFNVSVFDKHENIKKKNKSTLKNAKIAFNNLTIFSRPKKGKIAYETSLKNAVKNCQLIIESVPERIEIKRKVYSEIEASCSPRAIIASSTSGLLPSDLQAKMKYPQRFVVAHPFNPVYLIPLVEIVGGQKTSNSTINSAIKIYKTLGMYPIHLKKEIEAFVADRLLEAMWRESLWLVKDGICTTHELDNIVKYGFGLRYAQMGVFDTYRIAGGDAGIRHFLHQFGPSLKWPWTKLTDVPELSPELIELISNQSDTQSGHFTINDLERKRDQNLIAIQKALKTNKCAAGKVLENYERKLDTTTKRLKLKKSKICEPIRTFSCQVIPDWTNENGYMDELKYSEVFSKATDNFLILIGCDKKYISAGNSFLASETQIKRLADLRSENKLRIYTTLISANRKKIHLFHEVKTKKNLVCATSEHLLIHVALKTRKIVEITQKLEKNLNFISAYHSKLVLPSGIGRAVSKAK